MILLKESLNVRFIKYEAFLTSLIINIHHNITLISSKINKSFKTYEFDNLIILLINKNFYFYEIDIMHIFYVKYNT